MNGGKCPHYPYDSNENEEDEDEDKCDWCGINITEDMKDDNAFNCVYRHCDKMLCGLKGCSRNMAYFSCCEECEEQEQACEEEDED
eukprot:775992-Prymnesium_polylepis.1